MNSEIDDYRYDGNDNDHKNEPPRQSIEVGTFPFECIEYDEIGHSDHYGDDDDGSSEERNIHRKSPRINIFYANDFANLKSPLVKYLISLMPYLMAASLLIPRPKANPDRHSAGSTPAALSTSG